MVHLFEYEGVLFHVNYSPGSAMDPTPTIHSAFSVDGNYHPIGCDLAAALHSTWIFNGAKHGESVVARPFFAVVAEDIKRGK